MAAQIIDGKALAAEIKARVRAGVQQLAAAGVRPCLAVLLVGDDPASAVYVAGKERDCAECGIQSRMLRLPADTTQQQLLGHLARLAADDEVHGILVQLPLPAQIDPQQVIAAIPPHKDVDGFTPANMGRLLTGQPCLVPCTPAGCLAMLKSTGLSPAGRRAVVVGRSNIVGKPMAALLLANDATVTVCHSKTQGLAGLCAEAEILVAAVGRPGFITGDMVRPGAVVIDVGINRGQNGKLCGDVDFAPAAQKAGFITPVPGGVGLMTRAMLMQNTLRAAQMAQQG